MDTNYYKKYEPIFGSWYIKRKIGEGSFGKVYEIERDELGTVYKAALKTITIPQSNSEIKNIMADGMSHKDVTAYYEGIVRDISSECQLMSQLKGNSNIVSYEDHQIIKHKDGIGWDILIRMELLTPINDYMSQNQMRTRDVIQMGIDLCKSLELCQKYNIIHRDVKPENVFISANGDFKLGDFGIARTAEKTMSGMSRKGTFSYMAPEVYWGKAYNSTVDIYSLGLVMYKMLNNNRGPFLPAAPIPFSVNDREVALEKRMKGDKLPAPVNAEGRLAEIILAACNSEPDKRYRSASEMRRDLEAILYNDHERPWIYPDSDVIPYSVSASEPNSNEPAVEDTVPMSHEENDSHSDDTVPIPHEENDSHSDDTVPMPHEENGSHSNDTEPIPANQLKETKTEKIKKDDKDNKQAEETDINRKAGGTHKPKKKIIGIVAAFVIVVLLIILIISKGVKDITGIEDGTEIYIGDTLTPEYVIEPQRNNDDKIKFSAANDEVISVNEDGEITAKKIGESKLIMQVGKYIEKVNIIVKAKVTEIDNVSSKIEITEGDTKTIEPKLIPEKFSDCEIIYDIKDSDIASINSEGKITAKKPGSTELIIESGGCELTVKIVVDEYIEPEPIYTPAPYTPKKKSDPFEDLQVEVQN